MTPISQHAVALSSLILCLLIVGLSLKILFTSIWVSSSRLRELALSLSISLFTVLLIFSFGEGYFRLMVYQSDFFGFTLTAENWWQRYWKPVNSYQYRDAEFNLELIRSKNSVLVLGDSIAAGHGIKNASNRFPDLLAKQLGDSSIVLNASICGWSTSHELTALKTHLTQFQPETVILSYFLNDIEGAATRVGIKKPEYIVLPSGFLGRLVSDSHLINYFYWRSYRALYPELAKLYADYLNQVWQDARVRQAHLQELREIFELSTQDGRRFILVIMPDLLQLGQSKQLIEPVLNLFKSLKAQIIDMHLLVSEKTAGSYLVGSYDSHPNEDFHAILAGELVKSFR
ncbi:MAG: GDSL-type esterase/lipase family protein [Bdellovibrionota bacterium]